MNGDAENLPHRFGDGGKETSTAVPLPDLIDIHHPHIGSMHQIRRL